MTMDSSYPQNLSPVEKRLNYTFRNPPLLLEALTHRSYSNESATPFPHNERLEFLGDAILGLIITEYLYRRYPNLQEGELSRLRSLLVDAHSCTTYTQKLGIQSFLLLGKGEQQTQRGRETILSDLFEAVIGAIYLDGGLEATRTFFFHHFSDDIERLEENPPENWKAQLQDYCQKKHRSTPTYEVLDETGPDHSKIFTIAVLLEGKSLAQGQGSSKKEAQQEAAKHAMRKLEGGPS